MKKQFDNQELYELTIEQDSRPLNHYQKEPAPKTKNFFDCNFSCNGTNISFKISDKYKSISIQEHNKD